MHSWSWKSKSSFILRKKLTSIFNLSYNFGALNQENDLPFIMQLELNYKITLLRNCGCIHERELSEYEQMWKKTFFLQFTFPTF
jgi:hypothetical protein